MMNKARSSLSGNSNFQNPGRVGHRWWGHGIHVPTIDMAWGFLGGLVGTLAMDLVLIGTLYVMNLPLQSCYTIVGETLVRFFSMPGATPVGEILLGVAAHYVIGPIAGLVFGMIVFLVDRSRVDRLLKVIGLSVLFVEGIGFPLSALPVILLKMTPSTIWLWFGGSLVMHFLLGIIMAAVVYVGFHRRPRSRGS